MKGKWRTGWSVGGPLPGAEGPPPRGGTRRSGRLLPLGWAGCSRGPGKGMVGVLGWVALASGISAQSPPSAPVGRGEGGPEGGRASFPPVEVLPSSAATGEPVRFRYEFPRGKGEGWALEVPPEWQVLKPLERVGDGVGGAGIWEALLLPLRPGELPAPRASEARGGEMPPGPVSQAYEGPTVAIRSLLPPPPASVDPAPLLPVPEGGPSLVPVLLLGVGLLGVLAEGLRGRRDRTPSTIPSFPSLGGAEAAAPPPPPSPRSGRGHPAGPPIGEDPLRVLRDLAAAWEPASPPPPSEARRILDQVVEGTRAFLALEVGQSLGACTTAELLKLAAEGRVGSPLEVLRICLEAADRGRFGPERETMDAFPTSLQALKEWLAAQEGQGGPGRRSRPARKAAAGVGGEPGLGLAVGEKRKGKGGRPWWSR